MLCCSPPNGAGSPSRRGSMSGSVLDSPPQCRWLSAKRRKYALFLSHNKEEAASDARYLRDLLSRMLLRPARIFLDSSDLTELRRLFVDGVQQSDALLLLGTQSLFHRPWCLLEILEASRAGVPVVYVPISGKSPTPEELTSLIEGSFEAQLEARSPGALRAIRAHLGGDDLSELKSALAKVACDAQSAAVGWHPFSSDNQILADAMDVCELAFKACAPHGQSADLSWKNVPTGWQRDADGPSRVSMRRFRHSSAEYSPDGGGGGGGGAWGGGAWGGGAWGRSARHKSKQDAAEGIPSPTSHLIESQRYGAFISHVRSEAGADARLLQARLSNCLHSPCFVDSSDLHNLDDLLSRGVRRSDSLVLLQTKSTLTRPWVLLELWEAVKLKKPVVTIHLTGRGYDFASSARSLLNLKEGLRESSPGAYEALEEMLGAAELGEMEAALALTVPSIVSVSWNPAGSDHHLNACCRDVALKLRRQRDLAAHRRSSETRMWRRGSVLAKASALVSMIDVGRKPSLASSSSSSERRTSRRSRQPSHDLRRGTSSESVTSATVPRSSRSSLVGVPGRIARMLSSSTNNRVAPEAAYRQTQPSEDNAPSRARGAASSRMLSSDSKAAQARRSSAP
jgi:hypothetical protein